MKFNMKGINGSDLLLIAAIGLSLFCRIALANPLATKDGTWMKDSIGAYERATVTKNSSDDDIFKGVALVSYISGVLSVHQQNNMTATLIVAASKVDGKGKRSTTDEARLRTAFSFVPLLSVPDNISTGQTIAILKKYLNENPEKWQLSAHLLIQDAFKEAFEKH